VFDDSQSQQPDWRVLKNPKSNSFMKTIHWILTAVLAGGAAVAEEAKPDVERPQRPISAALLKQFDQDGDGKLSPEERAEMQAAMRERRRARHQEMLKRFDADGDGRLNAEERKIAHDTILKEMLVKYDANGNGEIDREERRAMVEAEGHNPLAPFMRQRQGRGERAGRGEGRPRGERRQRPGQGTPSTAE